MIQPKEKLRKFLLGGLGGDYTPIVLLVFLFLLQPLNSQIVGSTSQLHQHAHVLEVSTGQENQIIGFTDLPYGLSFQDEQTTCTYNAVFGISHLLDLKGGSLYLDSDLELGNPIRLPSTGSIYGNGHVLEFPHTTKTILLPESQAGKSFTPLLSTQTFAHVGVVDWSFDNAFVALGTSRKGRCSQLEIRKLSAAALECEASHEMFESIRCLQWHPHDHVVAFGTKSSGRQDCLHVFRFDPISNQLLPCQSSGLYTKDVHAVSWHPTGRYLAVASANTKEQIVIFAFDGIGFYKVCSVGFKQRRRIKDNVLKWDPSGNYLAVGFEKSPRHPDLLVYYFDKDRIVCADSAKCNRSPEALDWSPDGTFLALGFADGKQCEKLTVFSFDNVSDKLKAHEPTRSGGKTAVNCVQWSVDGKYLAVAKQYDACEPQVALYSFDKRTAQFRLVEKHFVDHSVCSLSWSHDGQHIVTGEQCARSTLYRVTDAFKLDNAHLAFHSDVSIGVPLELSGECSFLVDGYQLNFIDSVPLRLFSRAHVKVHNATLILDDAGFVIDPIGACLQFKDCTLISKDNVSAVGQALEFAGHTQLSGKFSCPARVESTSRISLQGATTLTKKWHVAGHVIVNGRGNVLDLGQGGQFSIAPEGKLELNSVIVKGCNNDTFLFSDDTACIDLSHATLEMSDDITMTIGTMNVVGPSTMIVKGHTLLFDKDAHLNVDGIVLWQDWAGSSEHGAVECAQPFASHCSLINSGTIRTVGIDAILGVDGGYYDLVLANSGAIMMHQSVVTNHEGQLDSIDTGPGHVVISRGGSVSISHDLHLSPDHRLRFTKDTVFDGRGHTLYCQQGCASIQLDTNVTVTFKNCVFSEMDEQSFMYGNGSNWTLGNGTTWQLPPRLVLNRTWHLDGHVRIEGCDSFLSFAHGKFLAARNTTVELSHVEISRLENRLSAHDDSALYALNDVSIVLSTDVFFEKGDLDCRSIVEFIGPASFTFSSQGRCSIQNNSVLRFADGGRFAYRPSNKNRHRLITSGKSSKIVLDTATLDVGPGGLQIVNATIEVPTIAYFKSESDDPAKGLTFGNGEPGTDPFINILPGARIEVLEGAVQFS